MGPNELVEWVQRASRGDRDALEKVYLHLRPRVLSALRGLLSPDQWLDGEDLMQDFFCKLLSTETFLERLASVPSRFVLAYVLKVILRRAIREKPRRLLRWDPVDEERASPAKGDIPGDGPAWEELKRVVASLTPACRELFDGIFVMGESDAEVRMRLGIEEDAYRQRKHRLIVKGPSRDQDVFPAPG